MLGDTHIILHVLLTYKHCVSFYNIVVTWDFLEDGNCFTSSSSVSSDPLAAAPQGDGNEP